MPPPRHVFSVDVEDWYQGVWIPPSGWGGFERRLHVGMDKLFGLFEKHDVKTTCFILGAVAEEHPHLVRDLHAAGHEIATHGWSHTEVFRLTPAAFRDEIRRSTDLLQALTNAPVLGYRAPFFTIREDTLWALDILHEEGLRYDSSIHPIRHFRCGIPNADRVPTFLPLPNGGRLLEIPVSTYPIGTTNVPVGGGAYFRLYPYLLSRLALRRLEARGEGLSMYVHPWELDPDHPDLPLKPFLKLVRGFNLRSVEARLDRLFRDFSFGSYRDVYADLLAVSPPTPSADELLLADAGG